MININTRIRQKNLAILRTGTVKDIFKKDTFINVETELILFAKKGDIKVKWDDSVTNSSVMSREELELIKS